MPKLISKAVLAGATTLALFVAAPVLAAAPYYFVDHISNKQVLFTNSSCTGAYVKGCGKFTRACGSQFWSGKTAFDEGVWMLRHGQKIHIRRNANPYNVVCTINPK